MLDLVDLGVSKGETLCILGPSGAGKSMFLRTVVRLHEHTSGEVLLDGDSIFKISPQDLRRRVAFVPQSPAMLDGSVEQNLRFGLDLAGVPREEADSRIKEALKDASLDEGFLTRTALKLSGGERQRVAIARAHAMCPEVLLLDEPTAALDPRTTRTVEDAILRLKSERGFTMVIVTHDVEQSKRLGDRTVLMREGRVIAVGDSDTIIDDLDPKERNRYLGELEKWELKEEGE